MRAFDWILKNKDAYGIQVVNISIGTTCREKQDHRQLIEGVERLWDAGLVVVAAAGNQGPRSGSVTAPGSSRKIITVGSSDLLTGRTAISGRGPYLRVHLQAGSGSSGQSYPVLRSGNGFCLWGKSGTSMSTPLVSGAAALLLQKYPTLTNVEIKRCLKESARDLGLPRNLQGSGELDMKQALTNESISVKMIRKM